MNLFNGVITISNISTLLFVVFAVLLGGYLLGRITIKGISLGDAGVFIIALVCGALFFGVNETGELLFSGSAKPYDFSSGLSIVESLGLVLFVTSVGYIAGPKFFGNFKKNFKSYVILALVVIVMGGLSCAGCILVGQNFSDLSIDELTAMLVGLLSGSLTSTPAFSAAKATVVPELEDLVSVGHGIAYLFGVIGVVLFVQIVPKIMKADMAKEREKLVVADSKSNKKEYKGKLIEIDEYGIMPFALAAICGIFLGSIKIGKFSLTTTGGCLLVSLILGHFARIGKISVMPKTSLLKVFRELGLILFLVGAGVAGGASFVKYFEAVYFLYGIIMTIIPMIVGFLFAKYVLKLSLLNNLGSITGGMTSTPALGTLINTAGTEDVASAYAATYPVALIAVVLVSQFLIILFYKCNKNRSDA